MGSSRSRLRVLFLTLYPETMPSSRLRIHQYLPHLDVFNIDATVMPAIAEPWFSRVYYSQSKWMHLLQYITEFFGTFRRTFEGRDYDVIYIQKGILLSNFRGFDRLLAWANRRLIFDLDDAVYGTNVEEFQGRLLRWIQDRNQTDKLSRRCHAVVAGNSYLKSLALRYNRNVYVLPTPVDTDRICPAESETENPREEIVIGWMGMPSGGLTYLSLVEDALREVSVRYPVRFRLVTLLRDRTYHIPGVKVEIVNWLYERESRDMSQFDIAIAPLFDDAWAKGKCSLKLLQYMAVGLPTVSSRAGMNCEVIEDGVDGFLADSTEEWIDKLSRLIEDTQLRKAMGQAAREKVVRDFSLKKMVVSLAQILREVSYS